MIRSFINPKTNLWLLCLMGVLAGSPQACAAPNGSNSRLIWDGRVRLKAGLPTLESAFMRRYVVPPSGGIFCSPCSSTFVTLAPFRAAPTAAEAIVTRPAGLGFTLAELLAPAQAGFVLLHFNGKSVIEQSLQILSHKGENLQVGFPDRPTPRFTFRIEENPDYIVLRMAKAEGDFSGRDMSLLFRSSQKDGAEAFCLDYMVRNESPASGLRLLWPYLWNPNPADPRGAFAVIKQGPDAARDESLAAIWAEGTLPHPATGKPWTREAVKQWVTAYHAKFAGLSETTLSASNPQELNRLTDWLHGTGIRRVYLHTDTWREEYWPKKRSFVDVNPNVFPGGRKDLKTYSDDLKKKGMLLRLHNVSAGIGPDDPEFILGDKIDSRLATWVTGKLEKPVGADDHVFYFRPSPAADFPHLRLAANWRLSRFRIGNEIVSVAGMEDVDGPVWRLIPVNRGKTGPSAVHAAGVEMTGLLSAYGQNFIPDNNSDLLEEMATRYANLINEVGLDHQHYDGAEIHCHLEPWGFAKLSWLVARKINRATTSSTSGGRPSAWNFELNFSTIRDLKELGYWAVSIPMLLDGHRNASSWLDAHFEVGSRLLSNARRVGFTKPEPFFGIETKVLDQHGLLPSYTELAGNWMQTIGSIGEREIAWLRQSLTPVQSKLRQRGNHSQSYDVPVMVKREDGFYFVPTRVMLREGLDAPWLSGQEFGPVGPRQYLQPGQKVTLTNPHAPQAPDLILHLLPALDRGSKNPASARAANPASGADTTRDAYNTGTISRPATDIAVASPVKPAATLWPQASGIRPAGDTRAVLVDGKIELTATNPTTDAIWEENSLPSWSCRVPMLGRRGVGIDVIGDGSGAVLLLQLASHGTRDYVVKLDFTGPRRLVIPNGEVSWSAACWGWRFDAHSMDYAGTLSEARLGFGYIPPGGSPKVTVTGIELLDNLPGRLCDPVIHMGAGALRVHGVLDTSEYLTFTPKDGIQVFDRNWNFLRGLKSTAENWMAPQAAVDVWLENPEPGPQPWLELQMITRGTPFKITQPSPAKPLVDDPPYQINK